MKIFISYATADLRLVGQIAAYLQQCQMQPRYWNRDNSPGVETWREIFAWIREADIVLVLITEATLKRSMAVGNEVGFAHAHSKLIVPLVAESVPRADLGFLGILNYIPLKPQGFNEAIGRFMRVVNAKIVQQSRAREVGWALAGIGALIFAAAAAGETGRRR